MKKGFTLTQTGILLTLWLTFLLSFVMRLSWSSLMPIVNEALHFTAQQGTSYLTAFYFGYALTVLPGGLLADRFGYRKSILGSLVAMAIVTGLMSTVQSYEYGLVLRFLLGIVSGPESYWRAFQCRTTWYRCRYFHELYIIWDYRG